MEFASRDPNAPAFWDECFERGVTPWDRDGVPEALRDFVARTAQPLRTLIPGCGAGYELGFLLEQGWDANALDFSAVAVATARARLESWAGHVLHADFFAYGPPEPIELIYERAFLCALPAPDVGGRGGALGWFTGARRAAGRILLFRQGDQGAAIRHRARGAKHLAGAPFCLR